MPIISIGVLYCYFCANVFVFKLDPGDVEVVNSSLTLLPTRSDHNNKSAVIKILIEVRMIVYSLTYTHMQEQRFTNVQNTN